MANEFLIRNGFISKSGSTVQSTLNISGNTTSPAFVTVGGIPAQFVKGDGTLDSNAYSLTGHTHAFSGLTGTGHTHTISNITNFPTNVSYFTNDVGYLTGYTDTTYSAGTGLDLIGTVFSHSDTSSQASSNNSGRTYIQDILLDTFGHITGITTSTETVVNTNDYVTSGNFNSTNGNLTLTRLSGGTVVTNLDNRYSLTGHTHVGLSDDYVSSAGFNATSGVLTLTRISGGTVTTNLDNRYSLTGHTHNFSTLTNTGHTHTVSEISNFPTVVSYFTNDVGYLTAYTDTNIFVTGSTFNTGNGVLTFTNISGDTFTVDIDGRYLEAHPAVSAAASSNNSGRTYIQDILLDTFGHITGITTSTETVVNTDTNDYVTSGAFNTTTGDLTLTRLSGGTVVTNLDNRYSLTGHTHAGYGDMFLGQVQTVTSAKTFNNNTLLFRNPANTFSYTITAGAITAARVLNLPVITATDTIAVLALAQTFTNKTLTSPVINTQITGTVTSGGSITTTNYLIGATATQTLTNKTLTGPVLNGLSNQASEATALMIDGAGIVGTRELGTGAFSPSATTGNFVTLDTAQTITATKVFSPASGTAITVNTNQNQFGVNVSTTTSGGTGVYSQVTTNATAFMANQTTIGTGFNYVGRNNGTNTFTVDKTGDIIANSIDIGGAGLNVMLDDGTTAAISGISGGTGTINGSGTTNYIPKWTGTTALGNSVIYDNGTNVGIGIASGFGAKFEVSDSSQAVKIVSSQGIGMTVSGGNNTNDIAQFQRLGVTKVVVDTDGYLGILNSNPTYALDVSGVGNFTGNIYCGVEDTTNGIVHIHGNTTNIGGEVRIYAGATQDTTIDYWRLHSTSTFLALRSSGADAGSLWLGSVGSTLYNPSGTGYLVLGTSEMYMSDTNDQKAFSISGDHSSNTGQVRLGDWDGAGNGFWCRLDQPNSTFETNGVIKSTKATGTAPFTVASTTNVTNLNADTVDGIQGINIVYGSGTGDSGRRTTNLSNFNVAIDSGFYDGSSATGAPTADWYHLLNNAHNNSTTSSPYQMQIAGNFFNLEQFYIRGIKPGTVGTWRRISHEGYLGAGGTNTQIQYNNNGVLDGFGNNNLYTVDLAKPLLLEPWSSHPNAKTLGAMAYDDGTGYGRPKFAMFAGCSGFLNSAEGQSPNDTFGAYTASTGTFTVDWTRGGCAFFHLTGNLTINVTSVPDGASGTILVKQDGTGSRTVTWGNSLSLTNITIGSITSINATANKYSTVTYKRNGSILMWVYGQQA